ncbi:uncharacterized protein LOC118417175 [Branchiostoma floridae]|uniref:Uncharacterized protein LOC118417175 n=1 Tax=Branchiostoma floridae TaxID=7739 RepID=A0A9J7MSS4_BRAFL|nr:uncharacterized protein LOC118417175 [Branchiostoma floridae]
MEEDRRVEDFSAGAVILGRIDGIPALEFDKMDTTVDGDLSESGGAALPVIHYHVYNISQVENVQIGTNNVIDKTGYDDRDFVDGKESRLLVEKLEYEPHHVDPWDNRKDNPGDLSKTDSGITAPSVIHNHYYNISQVENVQIGHDNVMNTSACEDEDFVDAPLPVEVLAVGSTLEASIVVSNVPLGLPPEMHPKLQVEDTV